MSDVGLFLIMFAGLLILLGVLRFLAWLTELQNEHGSLGRAGVNTIKRYVATTPRVMSRSEDGALPSAPSSLQTDDAQTDRQSRPSAPTSEQYLTLFRALRAAGVKREDIRPALKSVGLKLDNNLWADAAPAADEQPHLTPIVGRRTDAKFETDADFPYQNLT